MKQLARIISVLMISLLIAGSLPHSAAAYAPSNGFTFNNPAGSTASQYAIINKMNQGIANAPKGSTIRIALFSANVPSFTNSVLAAKKRGVNIRVVASAHSAGSAYWPAFRKALGGDITKPSFAVNCALGCFATREDSFQHSKFLTFSQSGTAKQVVMVGSSNQTDAQAEHGFNNMYTFNGNPTMYAGFYQYFDRMAASAAKADNVDYFRSVGSGAFRAYYSPSISARTNPYTSLLDSVKCTAKRGYGYNGRTTVRVGMAVWSNVTKSIADKLVSLDNQGCIVEVILSAHATDTDVQNTLLKSTRYGGIELRNATRDLDRNGTIDRYIHDKAIAISGGYGSGQTKAVWTGSFNLTYSAFRSNNDVILRITNATMWRQYVDHFQTVKKYAPEMKKAQSNVRTAPFEGMTSVETTPYKDLSPNVVFPE